jgi:hypothetical protein
MPTPTIAKRRLTSSEPELRALDDLCWTPLLLGQETFNAVCALTRELGELVQTPRAAMLRELQAARTDLEQRFALA